MSASPMDMQGLLAALSGPQPSQQGGLMGAINASLAPYGGAAGLGLALMGNTSGATAPGAALAQGMQNAQQYQQKLTSQQIQNAQGLMQLRQAMIMQSLMNSAMQGGQGQATPQGAPSAAPAGAPPAQAPAGAYDASAGPALPQDSPLSSAAPLGAPQTPGFGVGDVSQIPIQGMNPRLAYVLALNKTGDPTAAAAAVRNAQLAIAKQQIQPQLDLLDGVINSANPVSALQQGSQADPRIRQAWMVGAKMQGFDPNDLSNVDNVRLGLTQARNALASQAELPSAKAPDSLEQINGPLGQRLSRNRVTGEVKQEVAPQETAQFITPQGVQMLTKAEGMAKGYQPFNPTIFGAANTTDQAIQFAADTYRTTGKFPPAMARNPVLQAKVLARVASDAAANGDTTGAIAARQSALKANGVALDQVTKLETATNGYAATLDKNLTNLEQAYAKAGNMGSPLLTRAQRAWQQGITGDPDTASMVTWLNAVQGEYAKLKSGNLGNAPASDSQMRDAKEVINKYMNEGGIAAVGQAMREEAANRKAAIAEQKQSLMGSLGQSAPGAPQSAPKPTGASSTNVPNVNSKGWTLHQDKNGNRAYVSPDGKQYQVVQ